MLKLSFILTVVDQQHACAVVDDPMAILLNENFINFSSDCAFAQMGLSCAVKWQSVQCCCLCQVIFCEFLKRNKHNSVTMFPMVIVS